MGPPVSDSDNIAIVDIGASRIRVGQSGADTFNVELSAPEGRDELVSAVADALALLDNSPVEVLVASPGIVHDSYVGKCLIPALNECPLSSLLSSRVDVPVSVFNDGRATAIGWLGEDDCNLACMIAGSRIGGGIVIGRTVYEGRLSEAGEFGHLYVGGSDAECECGRRGCLDTIASGKALESELGTDWYTRAGSDVVKFKLELASEAIAVALAQVGSILYPDRLICVGHIFTHSLVQQRLNLEYRRRMAWGAAPIEFHPYSWTHLSQGLTRLRLSTGDSDD